MSAPSTLAEQIAAAQAEVATWPPGMLERFLGRASHPPVAAPAPATPAASVDTAGFRELVQNVRHGLHAQTWPPLIAHIDAHTARAVAAAEERQSDLIARLRRQVDAGVERSLEPQYRPSAAPQQHAQPDLRCVIRWLENGCDPLEAAKELRAYQTQMGLPDVPVLAVQQHAQAALEEANAEGYMTGLRVGLLEGASIIQEAYVNHVFHTGAQGLEDRCKNAQQVLLEKADATLAAHPANGAQAGQDPEALAEKINALRVRGINYEPGVADRHLIDRAEVLALLGKETP